MIVFLNFGVYFNLHAHLFSISPSLTLYHLAAPERLDDKDKTLSWQNIRRRSVKCITVKYEIKAIANK